MRRFGKKLLHVWERWERPINLGGMALGFATDLYLAKRPDSILDNLLLLFYLLICASIIVVLNIRRTRRRMDLENPTQPLLFILILQFCFGGLANNMLILYGKSGTVSGTLLFVGLLLALALGNEFLRERYEQLRFNVAIYYFLLLTYCVIAVPTFLFHSIGTLVFLASVGLSLLIIALFLFVLHRFVFYKRERRQLLEVSSIVAAIAAIFAALYFFNVIPPVPLSVKTIGIYHSLGVLPPNPEGDLYSLTYEPAPWYAFWRDAASTFTLAPSEGEAYCYSAVFAPGSLSAPIVHRWEKYDGAAKRWVTESRVSFPISGGRAGGYRGWSAKSLSPGEWRCDVETTRGQLIGRTSFTVIESSTTPALSTETL